MDWLKIKTSTELIKVAVDDIIGVIAAGNYSDLLTINGKHTLTFQLHHLEEAFQKLKDNDFVRVGRSLIVNRKYICFINLTSQTLILSGGALRQEYTFKVSRESLKVLMETVEKQ